MKFTVPISILYGPARRKFARGIVTFSARSIHQARAMVKDGIYFGYDSTKVRPLRK